MKKILLTAVAFTAILAGAASAQGAMSYNVAIANDYVFRGVSQTSGKGTIQAGADYSNGIFYAGVWGSNVSFSKSYEADIYVGVKPTIGKLNLDIGALHYFYDDQAVNTTEFKIGASYPVGKGTVGGAYYVNGDDSDVYYTEINGSYPLADTLSISAAIGDQHNAFTTANIGLTYQINKAVSLDVRYSDTNAATAWKDAGPRTTFLLKAAF